MKQLTTLTYFIAFILLTSCQEKTTELKNGVWRAVLQTDATIDIPFNFEVYDSLGTKQIAFLNGKERLNVSEVNVLGDSVFINTPLYETQFRALITNKGLEGVWIKDLPDGLQQRMPFSAEHGVNWRHTDKPEETNQRLEGKWSVKMMRPGKTDTTFSIGEFKQIGNAISGTFLTNFGDYRFLSGEMNGDDLFLSNYTGLSATLVTGHFLDSDNIVNGKIYTGPTYVAEWTAHRDSTVTLADAYTLTKLIEGETTLDFQFPDTEGNLVSPKDERFKNKVIVLQFLGSWCPNCMDETAFLSPFYEKYKDKGLVVIGLAYERYAEQDKAKKAVNNLIKRFDVSYPILLTGFTNKQGEVQKSLPQLASFSAFPTTIIIDKKGEVSSIHTGFNGPATGQVYVDYIKDFEEKINRLLNE